MATVAVVLLTIILVSRFARYARARRGDAWGQDGPHSFGRVAELERRLEEQQAYVHSLEDRVMRLEEGLDFAERMLAERNG